MQNSSPDTTDCKSTLFFLIYMQLNTTGMPCLKIVRLQYPYDQTDVNFMFQPGLVEHFPKASLPTFTGCSKLVAMCMISGGAVQETVTQGDVTVSVIVFCGIQMYVFVYIRNDNRFRFWFSQTSKIQIIYSFKMLVLTYKIT